MDIFWWPSQSPPDLENTVATLGTFDGVHLAHQKILNEVVKEAHDRGTTAVAITVDAPPAALLGESHEPTLTSVHHRARLMGRLGIDCCMVIEFTDEVARIEAPEFVRRVLCETLDVELLILGFDSHFGKDRQGNAELCRRMGQDMGFDVRTIPPVKVDDEVISSSNIRRAIMEGDMSRAARLLGRPYALLGTVVHGDGRGHSLGYPTMNLSVQDELLPPPGVYAARVREDDRTLDSVASIGRRITFHSEDSATVVEAHVLDEQRDFYGEELELELVERIRPQRRFPSAEDLAERIAEDVTRTRAILEELEKG